MSLALGALPPGTVFAGKYRVEKLLGAGGMGAVYLVTHLGTQAKSALKVMQPDVVADPTSRARFVQEARVASMIDSAFIVSVTDAGIDDETGIPYFVMEYLRGQELGAMIKSRGRIEATELLGWLAQAARALDKAHQKGIVHRDLKPENLFVVMSDDEPPKIKVLDFGIAKILQSSHTNSTQASGTPMYMAPEQTARGSNIGPWTDIWALGLLTYMALVGKAYWEAENIYQLFGEIVSPTRESPVARAARAGVVLPAAFDAWLLRCLAPDQSARFGRASEAVAALAEVFGLTPSLPPASQVVDSLAPARPAYQPVSGWPGPHSSGAALAPVVTQPSPGSPFAPPVHAPFAPTTSSPAAIAVGPSPAAHSPASKPSRAPLFAVLGALVVAAAGGAAFFLLSSGKGDAPKPATAAVAAASTESSASNKTSGDGKDLRKSIDRSNAMVRVGDGMFVQKHEVTRGEYAKWVASLPDDDKPGARPLRDWNGEPVEVGAAKKPVVWVTHARAKRFCEAIGARLPTSAEWSKALGGAKYPWGSAWPPPKASEVGIGKGDEAMPADVESMSTDVTDSGIYDLAGNVREWTSTVEAGFATVRGAAVDVGLDDAPSLVDKGAQKASREGDDAKSHAEEVAGRTIGFRCVR